MTIGKDIAKSRKGKMNVEHDRVVTRNIEVNGYIPELSEMAEDEVGRLNAAYGVNLVIDGVDQVDDDHFVVHVKARGKKSSIKNMKDNEDVFEKGES